MLNFVLLVFSGNEKLEGRRYFHCLFIEWHASYRRNSRPSRGTLVPRRRGALKNLCSKAVFYPWAPFTPLSPWAPQQSLRCLLFSLTSVPLPLYLLTSRQGASFALLVVIYGERKLSSLQENTKASSPKYRLGKGIL
ncbi:hypothetical protein NIES267_41780 [Calothrix parasitica NIES-267]|uniref:Uncharacterized protein n=1 Tax=Calothrix parasitica NIES-267 TaxID=1973488 RepID=A0A1Z4LTX1_9CYAN|nr:hypothetical protein NIES267_41780 [Calothrix parasitica NIES-267]